MPRNRARARQPRRVNGSRPRPTAFLQSYPQILGMSDAAGRLAIGGLRRTRDAICSHRSPAAARHAICPGFSQLQRFLTDSSVNGRAPQVFTNFIHSSPPPHASRRRKRDGSQGMPPLAPPPPRPARKSPASARLMGRDGAAALPCPGFEQRVDNPGESTPGA